MVAAATTKPSSIVPAGARLTSVRVELGWFAFWPALAALAGLGGFVTRGPTVGDVLEMVGVALVLWAASAVWLTMIRGRLRHTVYEPLGDHPRASGRAAALRGALPLGGMSPALLTLLTDTSLSDSGTRALFAGLILGVALGCISSVPLVIRAERAAGGRLFYARRPMSENMWFDRRALLSRHVVYLIDVPGPGEQRRAAGLTPRGAQRRSQAAADADSQHAHPA